jgi:hypothetical protein
LGGCIQPHRETGGASTARAHVCQGICWPKTKLVGTYWQRSSSRVSLQTLKAWLRERGAEWSAFTLVHRACIIDGILDFLVREESIASNPVAELCTKYSIKGSETIPRALLYPEPEKALEALRQLSQFGSINNLETHLRAYLERTGSRMTLRVPWSTPSLRVIGFIRRSLYIFTSARGGINAPVRY